MSHAALRLCSVDAENGIEPHKAVMLFNPMNWFVDEADEVRGKVLKSFLELVQFTTLDEPDKFRFDDFIAICHRRRLLVIKQ